MKKALLILALALPAFATTETLFSKYEAVRQGLLESSLRKTQTSAAALAAEARAAKQPALAAKADAVRKSPDMAKARANFAAVSDELIRLRAAAKGKRPAVYHCPMVAKSWLQPKGQVGNPYDASMATCGVAKED